MPNSPSDRDLWEWFNAYHREHEEVEQRRLESLERQRLMAQAQSDLVQAAERDRSRQVPFYLNELAALYNFAWLDGDDVAHSGQIPAAPQPQPAQPEEPRCRCEACISVEGAYMRDWAETPPVTIRQGASLSDGLHMRAALERMRLNGEGGERNDR